MKTGDEIMDHPEDHLLKKKDKEEKKVCFSQLQFLTGLTLEPQSHQFPNTQFYRPITQQNMTWSMIWKFSAACIDQIYKQNTTVSCSEFTADEVMFKTINEIMLEYRRKKPNWYKRVKMLSAQLFNNLPYNWFFELFDWQNRGVNYNYQLPIIAHFLDFS